MPIIRRNHIESTCELLHQFSNFQGPETVAVVCMYVLETPGFKSSRSTMIATAKTPGNCLHIQAVVPKAIVRWQQISMGCDSDLKRGSVHRRRPHLSPQRSVCRSKGRRVTPKTPPVSSGRLILEEVATAARR